MLKALVTAIAASALLVAQVAPAFACGVKLTVKAPKISKTALRSSNPSTILLLGKRDSRLAQDLRRRGHTVEQASTVSSARRDDYRLVVADPEQRSNAEQTYPGAIIVARSDADTNAIEDRLERAPRRGGDRQVIARRDRGKILRAGPVAEGDRELTGSGSVGVEASAEVGAEGTDDTPVATGPAPQEPEEAEEPVAAAEEPEVRERPARRNERVAAIETQPAPEAEEPAEEAQPAPAAKWHREFYFATASNRLRPRDKRRMRANARWLAANPQATIVIEGHTDTVGASEFNMGLGERRAEAARQFLIGLGVDASRIEIVSKGEDEPAYSPGTSAKNRRVVLIQQ